MPYIKQEQRDQIDGLLVKLNEAINTNSPGELNYAITDMLTSWLSIRGETYTVMNELIGVLECVKTEFYRRVIIPYEKRKEKENGDVY